MKLKVLGSGSKGNCYVLYNETEALVIEAGVPFQKVLRWNRKVALMIQGVLVTHEHKDHAGYAKDFMQYVLPVYMTRGTAIAGKYDALFKPKTFGDYDLVTKTYEAFKIGNFLILPFVTEHDACEPCGLFINHPEIGNLLFATDTNFIQPKFKGLTNIMIECNFAEGNLQGRKDIPEDTKRRIRESHMSVHECMRFLNSNDISMVNNIVLIHLSEGSADPERFKEMVEEATDKNVHLAVDGIELDFNRTPF